MFTGIIQGMATVTALKRESQALEIELDLGMLADGLTLGASVSCAGVCLTVTSFKEARACFYVMKETLDRTTLSALTVGEKVNIERAAKVGDEVGGHLVSGHVMGTGVISRIDASSGDWVLRVRCDKRWMPYLFSKGFVALDGCSLTVVDVQEDSFTVHLIPETRLRTTFGIKEDGHTVNIEIDPMTQAVVDTAVRMQSR